MSQRFVMLSTFVTFLLVTVTSCSPVKFSADQSVNVTPAGPGAKNIKCTPRLNGSSTSVTIPPTGPNPSVSANCTPANVTYTWVVERNGTPVTVPGLSGASSTPNFAGMSDGVYLISLEASEPGWIKYVLTNPLRVTIQTPTPNNPSISCDPRLNGNATNVTLSTSPNDNPTVTANCTPSNVFYTWDVQRNGSSVVIAGLSGSSSVPNFQAAGPGTYLVNLNASAPQFNAFNSQNPLTVVVPQPAVGTPVNETHQISAENDKLDILLVIDDSSSMLADNQRLASRLTGFVNSLTAEGFDWQMCVTVTRAQRISTDNPNYYWGASNRWSSNPNSPAWVLKAGTPNTVQIFTNTINQIGAGWAGTDDERGIKAAYWHLWNGDPTKSGNSGCYRQNAGLAVIILSDEDVRSIGGDQSRAFYDSERNKPLETDDQPQNYVDFVRSVFNTTVGGVTTSKRFTVNSIIVKPGDSACLAQQDAEGSKAHYGVHYAQLSNLTGGHVGSICDSDFSANLNYFKDSIVRSQASVPLRCTPLGPVTVNVSPNYSYTTTVQGSLLVFNPQVPAGSTVTLQYTCP